MPGFEKSARQNLALFETKKASNSYPLSIMVLFSKPYYSVSIGEVKLVVQA